MRGRIMATESVRQAGCAVCIGDVQNEKCLPCLHCICRKCQHDLCLYSFGYRKLACPVCMNACHVPPSAREEHQHPLFAPDATDTKDSLGQNPVEIAYCDRHSDDRLKLYCYDCEKNVCPMCFADDHNGHKCGEVGQVARDCAQQLERYAKAISSRIDTFNAAVNRIASETGRFQTTLTESETSLRKRGEAVHRAIDDHVTRLENELQNEAISGTEEANSRSKRMTFASTSLESFKVGLTDLMSKGSPCDITSAWKRTINRAMELLEQFPAPEIYHARRLSFVPTYIEDLTNDDEQNRTGSVDVHTSSPDSQEVSLPLPKPHPQTAREHELEEQLRRQKIEFYRLKHGMQEVEEREKRREAELIALRRQVPPRRELRITQLSAYDYALSRPRLAVTLGGDKIIGLTSLGDQLYVLRRRRVDLCSTTEARTYIDVYRKADFGRKHRLDMSRVRETIADIVACACYRCLYILASEPLISVSCCVYRMALNGSVTKWFESDTLDALSLSIAPSGNLLLACQCFLTRNANALRPYACLVQELSKDTGMPMRQVVLKRTDLEARHAVRLTDGQFIASCRCIRTNATDEIHAFNEDGIVTNSYGGRGDVDLVSDPRHLAVDDNSQFVFVADTNNNRVLLLNSRLEFVCYVVDRLTSSPIRLYVDNESRRLYVGKRNGDVTVFQL